MSRKNRINAGSPPKGTRIPSPVSIGPEKVNLSFEYYVAGGEFCLSHCNKDDIRHYKDCVRKMTTMEWNDVLKSGGKGGANKQGLAFTTYEDHALKGASRPSAVDPKLSISAVRASERTRLFGFRRGQTFFILWYDRNHEIVPV